MLYEGPDERPASDDQEATTVLTLAPVLGLQACGCCSEDAKEGMEDGEGVEAELEAGAELELEDVSSWVVDRGKNFPLAQSLIVEPCLDLKVQLILPPKYFSLLHQV